MCKWGPSERVTCNVHLKKQHVSNIFPNMRSIYEPIVQKTTFNNLFLQVITLLFCSVLYSDMSISIEPYFIIMKMSEKA